MDLEMLYADRSNQGRDNEMDGRVTEGATGVKLPETRLQDNETRVKMAKATWKEKKQATGGCLWCRECLLSGIRVSIRN